MSLFAILAPIACWAQISESKSLKVLEGDLDTLEVLGLPALIVVLVLLGMVTLMRSGVLFNEIGLGGIVSPRSGSQGFMSLELPSFGRDSASQSSGTGNLSIGQTYEDLI